MIDVTVDKLSDLLDFMATDEFALNGKVSDAILDFLSADTLPGSAADSFTCEGAAAPAGSCPPRFLSGGVKSNADYLYRGLNPSTGRPFGCPSFFGGFDGGTEVSLYGRWFPGNEFRRNAFFSRLKASKLHSKYLSDHNSDVSEILTVGAIDWVMYPSGSSGGVTYAYQLRQGGVWLLIHENPVGSIPAVRIKYEYDALFRRDFLCVHSTILDYLEEIGFVVDREIVSRVDLQVTLNCDFSFVEKAFQEKRVVSRVKKWDIVRKADSYIYVRGGQALQVCFYDKSGELLETRNDDRLSSSYACLEDVNGYDLTRIEFRLRREFLKLVKLNTVGDIYSRIADLIKYLTCDWIRFLADDKIRGKENKQLVSQEWFFVQFAFRKVFCDGVLQKEPVRKNLFPKATDRAIFRQALGCLSSAYAHDFLSEKLSFDSFRDDLLCYLNDSMRELYEDYLNKYKKLRLLCKGGLND